jgi:7-carboxy-7-deazaguanine synthase
MNAAPLAEAFVSFQGEGPWVGLRQLFVRVRGCDLTCRYCDTPAAYDIQGPCRVEDQPGSGIFEEWQNPITPVAVLDRLVPNAGPLHSLALTGGEPLLYPEFVAAIAAQSAHRGLPVYLETGGHRPHELARVIAGIAVVSMDFKLPSTLRAPVDQARFVDSYRVALQRRVCVKMVVAADTPVTEVAQACRMLAAVDPRGPVILQPVTPRAQSSASAMPGAPEPQPPAPQRLHELHVAASEHIREVRIIPQCHRLLGVA